ncbi:hypothetical protein Hdeb2414_s0011g00364961 [Helianthus debilis subsp. tardiflorus]
MTSTTENRQGRWWCGGASQESKERERNRRSEVRTAGRFCYPVVLSDGRDTPPFCLLLIGSHHQMVVACGGCNRKERRERESCGEERERAAERRERKPTDWAVGATDRRSSPLHVEFTVSLVQVRFGVRCGSSLQVNSSGSTSVRGQTTRYGLTRSNRVNSGQRGRPDVVRVRVCGSVQLGQIQVRVSGQLGQTEST